MEKEEKQRRKEERKKRKQKRSYARWFGFLRGVIRVVRLAMPFKMHRARRDYGEGPFVVIGNHYSLFDVMFPCMLNGKPVHFMAKQELWNSGFMRRFCNKSRCIPVSRDGASTDVKAIMQAMKYLKAGETIAIYPEGTRNKSGEFMLPFKGGFAALAIKTRTPIVPIVQLRRVRFFRRSHILYGEPIEFTEYYGKKLTEENIADCERRVREVMQSMRDEFIRTQEQKRAKKKGR